MKIIDDVITRFLKTEKIRWVDISQVKVDKEFKSIFPQKEADVQKIAGHTSLAMTDHYTRAAIPEMVEAVKPAVGAANRLFE